MELSVDNTPTAVYPTIDLAATGDNIRRLRLNVGLSVRELSVALCLADVQVVYKWQRGETLLSPGNLVLLSTIFHVTIAEIVVLNNCENMK